MKRQLLNLSDQENKSVCQSCQNIPDQYMQLTCMHNVCLHCVIRTNNIQENGNNNNAYKYLKCCVCEKITELDNYTAVTLEAYILAHSSHEVSHNFEQNDYSQVSIHNSNIRALLDSSVLRNINDNQNQSLTLDGENYSFLLNDDLSLRLSLKNQQKNKLEEINEKQEKLLDSIKFNLDVIVATQQQMKIKKQEIEQYGSNLNKEIVNSFNEIIKKILQKQNEITSQIQQRICDYSFIIDTKYRDLEDYKTSLEIENDKLLLDEDINDIQIELSKLLQINQLSDIPNLLQRDILPNKDFLLRELTQFKTIMLNFVQKYTIENCLLKQKQQYSHHSTSSTQYNTQRYNSTNSPAATKEKVQDNKNSPQFTQQNIRILRKNQGYIPLLSPSTKNFTQYQKNQLELNTFLVNGNLKQMSSSAQQFSKGKNNTEYYSTILEQLKSQNHRFNQQKNFTYNINALLQRDNIHLRNNYFL